MQKPCRFRRGGERRLGGFDKGFFKGRGSGGRRSVSAMTVLTTVLTITDGHGTLERVKEINRSGEA
jgi:hypothetical protein